MEKPDNLVIPLDRDSMKSKSCKTVELAESQTSIFELTLTLEHLLKKGKQLAHKISFGFLKFADVPLEVKQLCFLLSELTKGPSQYIKVKAFLRTDNFKKKLIEFENLEIANNIEFERLSKRIGRFDLNEMILISAEVFNIVKLLNIIVDYYSLKFEIAQRNSDLLIDYCEKYTKKFEEAIRTNTYRIRKKT